MYVCLYVCMLLRMYVRMDGGTIYMNGRSRNRENYVSSEILTAVYINITTLRIVTPCNLVER